MKHVLKKTTRRYNTPGWWLKSLALEMISEKNHREFTGKVNSSLKVELGTFL